MTRLKNMVIQPPPCLHHRNIAALLPDQLPTYLISIILILPSYALALQHRVLLTLVAISHSLLNPLKMEHLLFLS